MKSRKVVIIVVTFLMVLFFIGCNNKNNKDSKNNNTKKVVREREVENTTSISEITESKAEKEMKLDLSSEANGETSQVETEERSVETEKKEITQLPDSIMETVEYWKSVYPNMTIGVGLYSLDGTTGYEYNASTPINSACTIKATYALFVLQEAEKREIDIWETYITYEPRHSDPEGSGDINLYGYYGQEYSIAELVRLLLSVSDNVAYNMLLEKFTLDDFYSYNYTIGGQSDWSKWGRASVEQRKCEWVEIWNYINSDSLYSEVLRNDLTGTDFAYFVQGMQNWHSYMQKSGWTEDTPYYPAAGEAAIIDDSFILIVLTQDYSDYKMGHIDALQGIGGAVESYWNQNDGYIF